MTLHIIFSCDNSAFDPDPKPEIIHTLKKLIETITVNDRFPVSLFDTNGNRIGGCNLVLDDEEGRRNG
jgi:hypothetical protein